jgi:LAO/AO transport system kinase
MTTADLVRDASSRDDPHRQTRAAARLMSVLEREPHRLAELVTQRTAAEWSVPRLVLGITGAPGSGKSSLTDVAVQALRSRNEGRRVGVIAVDPSSPFTGGAVLGDRVRMMRHATDPDVFIRSLATRGHLGGLSLGVRGVLRVMGLIGCEIVILETVGVGQSEVEVAGLADLVAVVLAPGHGDSVQLLKAGLLEIADLIVINKSDVDGANELYRSVLSTLGLAAPAAERPAVLQTSARDGVGIDALVDLLESALDRDGSSWASTRTASLVRDVEDAVMEQALQRVRAAGLDGSTVAAGRQSVDEAVNALLDRARNERS